MMGFGFYFITNNGLIKHIFRFGGNKKSNYKKKYLKDIKLVVCDVDGVLTDGKMIYSEKGDELKNFNTKDGIAAKLLKNGGYKLAIISSGICINLINKRGNFLGFDKIIVTDKSKIAELDNLLNDFGLQYDNVLYIGDDINDYEAMKRCRIRCCPADACKKIRWISDIVFRSSGGDGCLREAAELLLGEADCGK
ncbi:MAG: HAD hydrolase-like protein [Bacteroidales bacterium]|jgi:N-acylneuraminate cytidylyltransferase|nr:HAD hydrolase-like protein [Bacteroidales bacterium]